MSRVTWRPLLRYGALSLVAFVLAHDLVFLLVYGASFGSALARTGHDQRWTATVVVVAQLSLILLVTSIVRLRQLERLARVSNGGRLKPPGYRWRALLGHLAPGWLVVFLVATLLFIANENLEHLSAGLPLPGLSVLGSDEYGAAGVVIAAVALIVALVDALYRWRQYLLLARLAAARATWARDSGPATLPWTPWVERRHAAISGHHIAGRAPPLAALA